MSSLSRLVLLASLVVTGCGGGGDDAADPDAQGSDDPGGDDPTLVDKIGCHMLQDPGAPFAVPPEDGATAPLACIEVLGPDVCLVQNTGCFSAEDRVVFEWQPGTFYNVKAFGWSVVSSSAGEVTTETNADSGILGVPPSTTVTSAITHDASGVTFDIVFRMEDEFVVFDKVEPQGGS